MCQVEIEVGVDIGRDEFIASEWHVAKAFGCIAGWVDRIVLDAAAGGNLGAVGFDEGRQGTRQTQAATGQFLLGKEDAVQQSVDVQCQQYLRELSKIDDAFVHVGKFIFELVENGLVRAFEDVGRIDPVRFQHRIGQRLAVLVHDPDDRQALEWRDPLVVDLVPAHRFHAIGHALRRFHQQRLLAVRAVV